MFDSENVIMMRIIWSYLQALFVNLICARMSDSGEYKTSEKESKSQEGETTKNSKKRMIDADDDEDPKNQSSKLENLKKVAEKTLPLACSICKEPFLDPIVTKCNHYFCHLCALEV